MIETDYLVIGSGLAGLYFALRAAEHGRVVVVTKRAPADANTTYAQGGVAAVLDPDDTVDDHVEDTLRVGDGLCHRDIVELCAREAPEHILRFANELGVPFDRDADGHLELGREGGHTARRVVHAKDSTGREIQEALLARRRRARRPHHDAPRPHGGRSADDRQVRRARTPCSAPTCSTRRTGEVEDRGRARDVLATGGAGKVYLYTTNPDVATGDGVAMAYRVGARVANMEFFQFHPTCLYHPAREVVPHHARRCAARAASCGCATARRSWSATTR